MKTTQSFMSILFLSMFSGGGGGFGRSLDGGCGITNDTTTMLLILWMSMQEELTSRCINDHYNNCEGRRRALLEEEACNPCSPCYNPCRNVPIRPLAAAERIEERCEQRRPCGCDPVVVHCHSSNESDRFRRGFPNQF